MNSENADMQEIQQSIVSKQRLQRDLAEVNESDAVQEYRFLNQKINKINSGKYGQPTWIKAMKQNQAELSLDFKKIIDENRHLKAKVDNSELKLRHFQDMLE